MLLAVLDNYYDCLLRLRNGLTSGRQWGGGVVALTVGGYILELLTVDGYLITKNLVQGINNFSIININFFVLEVVLAFRF